MQTRKTTLGVVWFAALVVAVTVGAGEDAPKPEQAKKAWQQLRPERLIADNALLYLCLPDAAKARLAFERTALHELLAEEEIGTPVLAAFDKLRDVYLKGDGLCAPAELERRNDEVTLVKQLAPLLDGQVAVALDAEMAAGAHTPRFLLVASMSSEDRQRELALVLEKHRYSQTTNPQSLDFNSQVGVYDVSRVENVQLGLYEAWAFVENLFIYGQGKRIVEDAVERYSAKNSAGSLALHGGYQNAYREVGRDEQGRDALLYLQVDATALIKNFMPGNELLTSAVAVAAEEQRPHLALGLTVSEGGHAAIKEKILFRTAKDKLPAPDTETLKALTARFAQNDTLFFLAAQSKLASFLKLFGAQARLKSLVDAANDAELLHKLEMFKGELGVFVSYVPQPAVKFDIQELLEMFQFVVALELDRDLNEVEYKSLMDKIEAGTKQTYAPTLVGNTTLRCQKGAAPREEKEARAGAGNLGLLANIFAPAQEADSAPFFLCYARVDLEEPGVPPRKFLLLADNMDALRKAAVQARLPRSPLAEEPRFKELAGSFRPSRRILNFVDLNKLVDIYGSLLPRFLSQDTFNKLPVAGVFRAHLFPAAWAASPASDAEGFVIETYSPTGNLPLLGLAGLTGWPVIQNERLVAVSREMDQKFKQLMLGLQLYAADFDRYPQQLSELYPNYVKNLSTFESPFRRNVLKTPRDIDNPDLSNLVYVPKPSLQELGNEVLIYEKDPTCLIETRDGQQLFPHVVTIDGKKTWLTRPALELRLGGKLDYLTPFGAKQGGKPDSQPSSFPGLQPQKATPESGAEKKERSSRFDQLLP